MWDLFTVLALGHVTGHARYQRPCDRHSLNLCKVQAFKPDQ
jgi:hypothetical protein